VLTEGEAATGVRLLTEAVEAVAARAAAH
jgi:hypothetical protein